MLIAILPYNYDLMLTLVHQGAHPTADRRVIAELAQQSPSTEEPVTMAEDAALDDEEGSDDVAGDSADDYDESSEDSEIYSDDEMFDPDDMTDDEYEARALARELAQQDRSIMRDMLRDLKRQDEEFERYGDIEELDDMWNGFNERTQEFDLTDKTVTDQLAEAYALLQYRDLDEYARPPADVLKSSYLDAKLQKINIDATHKFKNWVNSSCPRSQERRRPV